MKTRALITLTLLSATFMLAACDTKKKDVAAAQPPACTADSKDAACTVKKLSVENGGCSDEITDALNAISSLDNQSRTKEIVIMVDKACGIFNDKIGDTSCKIQDQKDREIKTISKDTVKKACDSVALTLRPAAATSENKQAEANTTTSGTSSAAATTSTTTTSGTPAVDTTTSVAATSVDSGKKAATEPATTTAVVPAESKKLSTLKNGLSFTLKRVDVINAVLKKTSYVQSGLFVEMTESLDKTKGYCYFDGTDFKLELAAGQIYNMTSIKATDTELTMISSDQKFTAICKKAESIRNLSAVWSIKELQDILDEAIEVKEISEAK